MYFQLNEYGNNRANRAKEEIDAANALHQCRCCGEPCEDGLDCCSDDFAEPADIREWA